MRTFTVTPYFLNRALASDLWNEMSEAVFDDRFRSLSYDVNEEENGFLISVDMPGLKKEDIKIELKEHSLMISGERKNPSRENYIYQKSFTLPKSADVEKIQAAYEDGVLEVFVPKAEAARPRTIEIQSSKKGFFGKLLSHTSDEKEVTKMN